MDRPGPLKDLPLDQFLLVNPNHSHKRPRPLSLFCLALQSAASSTRRASTLPEAIARRNAFSDVLAGPSSPAKRLDFDPPNLRTPSSSKLKNLHDCFNQSSSSFVPDRPPIYPLSRLPWSTMIPDHPLLPMKHHVKDNGTVVKENAPPRRKTQPQLLSTLAQRRVSERLKAKSTPATPKKSLVQHDSPTQRRTIFGQFMGFMGIE